MPAAAGHSVLIAALAGGRPGRPQEAILDEMRRAILSGEVPPGTPIPVDEAAELFGVSRIPIRESLKTLIGEGLVDHLPRAGYTVARLTLAELSELYIVRGVLERAALAAAVAKADSQDDQRASSALEALDAAIRADDYPAYQRESRRFHVALMTPSRMHRLLHMVESVWNITEPVQPMAHITDLARGELHAEHREMLRAFLARDVAALQAAAGNHQHHLEESIAALPDDSGLFTGGPTPA
jgi:DNA-binding GntR family transcriptional regulator